FEFLAAGHVMEWHIHQRIRRAYGLTTVFISYGLKTRLLPLRRLFPGFERRRRNTPIRCRPSSSGCGVHKRAVHFGSSRSIGCAPTRVRARLSLALAGELVPQSQSAGMSRGLYGSSGPVIVVQHAAQALPTLDLTGASEVARFWADELVRQTLM